jgi:hypothetical protein
MRRAIAVLALFASSARGEELPLSLQVQLLQKTATYITNLQPSDNGAVKVLVLYPGAQVTRGASALASGLNQAGTVGRFKVEARAESVTNLKAELASDKPQMIWLAPELDEKSVQSVIEQCEGSGIVTVSPVAAHVKLGVILGFDLIEAKPRILVNLKQARAQDVIFFSGLLTHSVIVER